MLIAVYAQKSCAPIPKSIRISVIMQKHEYIINIFKIRSNCIFLNPNTLNLNDFCKEYKIKKKPRITALFPQKYKKDNISLFEKSNE